MFTIIVSNFCRKNFAESRLSANYVVARNACWFTMATLSDGIDSQMMLRIIRESKKELEDLLQPFKEGGKGASESRITRNK